MVIKHAISLAMINYSFLNIIKIFSKTVPVGIDHGTVIVLWQDYRFEVTTFRIDGEYIDHRRPDQVQFVTDLKSDLERRDFTINALALSETHEIIDYFDGQKDLKNKGIHCFPWYFHYRSPHIFGDGK